MAKFFAKIESERAEKHQIGNDYIKVELFTGPKESSIKLGSFLLRKMGENIVITFNEKPVLILPDEVTSI